MRFTLNIFKKKAPSAAKAAPALPCDEKEVAVVKTVPVVSMSDIEREVLESIYNAYITPEVLNVKADMVFNVQGSFRQVSIEMKKDTADRMSIIVTPKRAQIAAPRSVFVKNSPKPVQLTDGSVYSITGEKPSVEYSQNDITIKGANSSDTTLVQQAVDFEKEYHTLKRIGEGAFGVVFVVQNKATTRLSAVKVLPKVRCGGDEAAHEMFMREFRAARMYGVHPFLMTLEASGHDDWGYQLMTTYCPGGDMKHELERVGAFSEARVKVYLAQLMLAVEHLHKHKIIHRDIKPANILIDVKGNAVLADLGLCHIFQKPTTEATWNPVMRQSELSSTFDSFDENFDDPSRYNCYDYAGTDGYTAPEVISQAGYTFDADIFSLGVTAFQMRCGRLPWAGEKDGHKNRMVLFNQVLREPVVFDARDKVSPNLQVVLKNMTEKDPFDRATIRDLKRKPFFRTINWGKLAKGKVRAPVIPPQCGDLPYGGDLAVVLPLGKPYTSDEDPYPEIAYRSPLVEQGPFEGARSGIFATLLRRSEKPERLPRLLQWDLIEGLTPSQWDIEYRRKRTPAFYDNDDSFC
ncbi:kinase-like protein [Gloeophyllum trabeum ATCC 11539]|uniref:Kinase-like protein n=1 Tax=Gloeophyllum trabeum (strain ATCC 11539 / FP-39264 / Madison 617) TaxID=670483 RepID=S7PWK7_GLOTA|nr:kinase-like protein [Gloeophyllum trabeum ATCC 11539]EPQ51981.1 kinase-like protein [Gloeophyllum trabeum ATCC 11539]